MTTGDQDLPAPERLTVALLGQRLDVVNIKEVWEKLQAQETLDSISAQESPIKVKRATGSCEFGVFEFAIASDRAVLTLAPRLMSPTDTDFQRLMRLQNFEASFNWITKIGSGLIDAMPTLQRVGVHGSFVFDFEDAPSAKAFVRSKLSFIREDSSPSEDLTFQLNRPIKSESWDINRIWTWQSARVRGILVSAGVPISNEFWMVRGSFDLNNAADGVREGTLEPEKCQQLLSTLSKVVRPFLVENV
jgi:hypothetical protein